MDLTLWRIYLPLFGTSFRVGTSNPPMCQSPPSVAIVLAWLSLSTRTFRRESVPLEACLTQENPSKSLLYAMDFQEINVQACVT